MSKRQAEKSRFIDRFKSRLNQPVDSLPLALFRMLFGFIMVWEVIRYFNLNRIEDYYLKPELNFYYFGWNWIKPLSETQMNFVFIAIAVVSFMIALGLFYRFASLAFFVLFSYVFLLDQAYYLNHFYLIVLIGLLFTVLPLNKAYSIDNLLFKRPQNSQFQYAIRFVMQLQIGIVYFFGGIAKINADWLQGEPIRMWLAERTDFPLIGALFTYEWMVYLFSYGGLFLDLLIFPLLMWKKSRPFALVIAVSFHLMNSQLFSIGIFPWFMIGATLLLFSEKLPFSSGSVPSKLEHKQRPIGLVPQLSVVFFLFFVFQCLFPLRHHLIAGNVAWTEEGHKFSWRMKLRDKACFGKYYVVQNSTGYKKEIDPSLFLNERQIRKMCGQPELISIFSRFLAEKLERSGVTDISIKATVMTSLNGRNFQLLIDSSAHLNRINPNFLGHDSFILPLTEELHPENLNYRLVE